MVILYCGPTRTEDMDKTKNRKDLILKNAKSILKYPHIISDIDDKSIAISGHSRFVNNMDWVGLDTDVWIFFG